jgi:hypothetical protein
MKEGVMMCVTHKRRFYAKRVYVLAIFRVMGKKSKNNTELLIFFLGKRVVLLLTAKITPEK